MEPVLPGLSGFEEVGRGGFGIVYGAFDARFGRRVAVKIIRDSGLGRDVYKRQLLALTRNIVLAMAPAILAHGAVPVSYTHLDVYKRQDLVIDGVLEADALRDELLKRLRYAARRDRRFSERRRSVPPV